MMKSLNNRHAVIVYPGALHPGTNGGAMRVRAIAKYLRQCGMRITLVSCDQPTSKNYLLELANHVELFSSNLRVERKDAPSSRARMSHIARNMNLEFHAFARKILIQREPDTVIAVFAWSTPVLYRLPKGVLRIVDTIDVQYRRHEVACMNGGTLDDRRCTREEEISYLNLADVILAIQRDEGEIFKAMNAGKRVISCEHALPVSDAHSPDDAKMVFFAGNSYDPNVRGIRAFIEEAWDSVLQQCPDAELHICGTVCSDLTDLSSNAGVTLHGVVPSLQTFYEQAAVVINPSLYGTGLPIKTVEALSKKKAFIGLENTVRGLGPEGKAACVVVDDLPAMGQETARLLNNLSMRREQENAASMYAETYLTPDHVYAELFEAISGFKPLPTVQWPRTFPFKRIAEIYPTEVVANYRASRLLSRLGRPTYQRPKMSTAFVEEHVKMRWQLLKYRDHMQRIALLGAGKHTQWLEYVLKGIDGPEVVAVLDSNDKNSASLLFGLPVGPLSSFDINKVDGIILSTDCWQKEMQAACHMRQPGDIAIIDLYEGLPPGPYPKFC